jgi:putative membrane protein
MTSDAPPAAELALPLPAVAWRRLSPRMLLIHPVREVVRFVPALVGIFFAGGSSQGGGHWWSLGALGVVLVLSVIRWVTTRYQITAQQVQLRTGLFRKRIITTPADRVRTVDVTEHALHRVLGLARVSIGTGTSDRKREALVLDGLSTGEARALRSELLHRAPAGGPWTPPTTIEPAGAETELARLDPTWVRFAPFTLSGVVTALAVAGFAWNSLNQSHITAGDVGAIQTALGQLRGFPVWLLVVQVVLGVVVVITAFSVVGYLLAFWRFRLTRHPGGTLQVTRGLITNRSTSIEHRRLRGVSVSQPLLLRAVGGARLTAVATGLRVGRGSERGGTVLTPPAPLAEVSGVADRILSGPGAEQAVRASLIPHPRSALRRRLARSSGGWLVLSLVLGALWRWAGWPMLLAGIATGALALSLALGRDRYAALGHAVFGDFLVTRYGSLDRRREILQIDCIIGWNFRQTIFQRRLGLLSTVATTAAGRQGYRLDDLDPDEALRVARAGTPGLLDEFVVWR